MQTRRGDMQTQRGEMQCMGLNLHAGQKAIKAIAHGEMRTTDCIMAAPRGRTTEPIGGSVNWVGPAMDTGEVGVTRDAITVIGDTEINEHEVTEKLKEETETQELTETKSHGETEIINEVTEKDKSIEGDELNEIDEHTQVELRGDNGVEIGECIVTWGEQQDSLLQERREEICSLEADRDEVGPVEPNEVERMSAVNGYTHSLGGMEAPLLLGVTRFPDMNVPVHMVKI